MMKEMDGTVSCRRSTRQADPAALNPFELAQALRFEPCLFVRSPLRPHFDQNILQRGER
jgi:hypothetical protein